MNLESICQNKKVHYGAEDGKKISEQTQKYEICDVECHALILLHLQRKVHSSWNSGLHVAILTIYVVQEYVQMCITHYT